MRVIPGLLNLRPVLRARVPARVPARVLALLLALVLGTASDALGEVKVSFDMGFGGLYRDGRWSPVYITVSDPAATATRNVRAELHSPHDQSHAISISTRFAIRPQPSTTILYVPLTARLDETVLYIRDLGTNKLLAKTPFAQSTPGGMSFNPTVSQGEILFGLSGRGPALGELDGPFNWNTGAQAAGVERGKTAAATALEEASSNDNATRANAPLLRVGRVEPAHLPDAVVGYDSLDVLVLNAPNLVQMPIAKQEAIAAWVRGGGRLMLWPGDHLIPGSSPIIDILPCTIGPLEEIKLSLEETKAHALASNVESLAARQLKARGSGRMYTVLSGKGQVAIGRVGLGNVAVLSFEADRLRFDNTRQSPSDRNARRFWRPILRELLQPKIHDEKNPVYAGWQGTPEDQRHERALYRVVDQLGNVPGVGAFDMTYILIVLLAMMFIVGPIDWWVLRKLNRQPWTWVTITGWIVLITTGAIFIGTIFKSGDLHYRTVRLVDQADGEVVGVHDVVGIYSPRTQQYGLDAPPETWWRPAHLSRLSPWQRQRPTGGRVDFDQLRSGQLLRGAATGGKPLATMTVNVWNLRFLESGFGDTSAVKPVIAAELRRVKSAKPGERRDTITGTITNLGGQPLRNVRILVRGGMVKLAKEGVAAGQSIEVSARAEAPPETKQQEHYYYGYYDRSIYDTTDAGSAFSRAACDLAGDRSARIERLLEERDDVAVIIADSEDVPVTVGLVHENDEPPLEKHWRVVRAVVTLK